MKIPFVTPLMNLTPIRRQSVIQLGFTLIVTFVGFFSTMLFTHVLGADLIGVYYLFLTYFSIFNLIGDSGFGAAATKRISEGKDQNEFFSAYFVLRTVLVIISTLILLAIQPLFVDLAAYNLVPFIIVALVVAYFSHTISVGVGAKNHIGITNLTNGISELVRIGFSILFVLLGLSFGGMVWGYIIGIAISGALCLGYFRYRPARFTRQHVWSLTSFGFWVLLIGTAGTLIGYCDTIFIGYFMENADVGVYRVALSFTTISLFVANAINSTLGPKISNWSANGQIDQVPHVISRSITYGLIMAIPIIVGGILLANDLMYFFYGAEFARGSVCACILFIQNLINVFLMFMGAALTNTGHVRKTFYGTLAAVVINVILDIALIGGIGPIPALGIEGASIGSVIAMLVNVGIIYWQLKNIMSVKIERKPIFHIVLASAIMGAIVFIYTILIPLTNVWLTLVAVVLGGLVYFLVLFRLDTGIHDDIKALITNFGIPWPKWL